MSSFSANENAGSKEEKDAKEEEEKEKEKEKEKSERKSKAGELDFELRSGSYDGVIRTAEERRRRTSKLFRSSDVRL